MMVSKFVDRSDAGRHMLDLFREKLFDVDALVVVLPAAVEIALAIASETTVPIRDLTIARNASGVIIPRLDKLAGLRVAVIDDGVESGTTALAIGTMLKAQAVRSALLMVPICPINIASNLEKVYNEVFAVIKPAEPIAIGSFYQVN